MPAPSDKAASPATHGHGQKPDRAMLAAAKNEATPQYYLRRSDAGIEWSFHSTRADHLSEKPHSRGGLFLHYANAGMALRVALHQAQVYKCSVANIEGLKAAALKDPEPEGTAKHWAAPGKRASK